MGLISAVHLTGKSVCCVQLFEVERFTPRVEHKIKAHTRNTTNRIGANVLNVTASQSVCGKCTVFTIHSRDGRLCHGSNMSSSVRFAFGF